MYIASGLLILSFGLTMLKFISCYSDGFALEDQCRGMNIIHEDTGVLPPQSTEPPFYVTPENVTLTESQWPSSPINVVLSAKSSSFRGFMLDARACDGCDSVGTFSLDDPDNSILICGDRVVVQPSNVGKTSISVRWTPESAGQFFFRAVFVERFSTFWGRKPILPDRPTTTALPATSAPTTARTSTTKPTILTTAPSIDSHATGTSAAPPTSETNSTQTNLTTSTTIFTTSNIDTTGTSAAPPTSEANSTQMSLTTSTTIFTTASNINSQTTGTSAAPPTSEANNTQTNLTTSATIFTSQTPSQTTVTPPPPPQCVQYVRCVLALLLFSRLCFLGGSSLLMIRPVLKKTVTMSASVLELAAKTIAAILVLIKAIQFECVHKCAGLGNVFFALTVTAMVSSLLHTITVFLHCGPSHELRKCWVGAIIIVDLMNTIITTTAIYFGIWCFEECWLAILMGVYVVWEIMLYLGSICFEQMGKYKRRKNVKTGNRNRILEKRISRWLFMFIIFTVFSVMLTAALMAGVSLVRMIN